MPSVPRRLVALLALPLLLAGCFGFGGGEDPVETATTNETNTSTVPTVLPDGREYKAVEETNKTEEGVGGVDHKHDYWHGKEQVTIFDADVVPDILPVFERGDNSRLFVAFINLETVPGDPEMPALVYEGTGLVTFTITEGPAWATNYQVTYRTAGQDWTPWAPITLGTPLEYEPDKVETDMPHSFRSLWNWKVQAVSPVPLTGGVLNRSDSNIHVTITVTKSREVDDWPGHPAFYDDVHERIVASSKPGKTNVQNAADVLIYGVEPDQVVPDRLISMGTRTLDVFVNISKLELPPGVQNGGFTLYWRSADTRPDDLGHFNLANETDDATYAYWSLQVEDDMVDSPYQPTSRFGFKVLANAFDDSRFACYRCVPYNIEYTMTVIARPAEGVTTEMMEG